MRHALYVMRDTDMFVRESPFPIPVGILYLWFHLLYTLEKIVCNLHMLTVSVHKRIQ